jgi:hypothetical protein
MRCPCRCLLLGGLTTAREKVALRAKERKGICAFDHRLLCHSAAICGWLDDGFVLSSDGFELRGRLATAALFLVLRPSGKTQLALPPIPAPIPANGAAFIPLPFLKRTGASEEGVSAEHSILALRRETGLKSDAAAAVDLRPAIPSVMELML